MTWPTGTAGHLTISVPLEQVTEVEGAYGVGRRVNVFEDRRSSGWIRMLELRRVAARGDEIRYLLAFVACEPPAPPN